MSILTSYLANLHTENGVVLPLLCLAQCSQQRGRGGGGAPGRLLGQAVVASTPGREQVQLCGLRVSFVSAQCTWSCPSFLGRRDFRMGGARPLLGGLQL